jgi:hypothetical protein
VERTKDYGWFPWTIIWFSICRLKTHKQVGHCAHPVAGSDIRVDYAQRPLKTDITTPSRASRKRRYFYALFKLIALVPHQCETEKIDGAVAMIMRSTARSGAAGTAVGLFT